jgi:hypothetical protein
MGKPKVDGRGKSPGSRRTQFAPGRAPRVKRELSEGSQGLYAAMQHVCTHPSSADTTHEQANVRRWLRKDPAGFMRMRAQLELAASRKARRAPQEKPQRDRDPWRDLHPEDDFPEEGESGSGNPLLDKLLARPQKSEVKEADGQESSGGKHGTREVAKEGPPPNGREPCYHCNRLQGSSQDYCPYCGVRKENKELAAPPTAEPATPPQRLLSCAYHVDRGVYYQAWCPDCAAKTRAAADWQ